MAGDVKFGGHEAGEIRAGLWAKREKRFVRFGGLGFFALSQNPFIVLRIFNDLVFLVGA